MAEIWVIRENGHHCTGAFAPSWSAVWWTASTCDWAGPHDEILYCKQRRREEWNKQTKSLCSTNIKSSLLGCLVVRGSVSAEREGSILGGPVIPEWIKFLEWVVNGWGCVCWGCFRQEMWCSYWGTGGLRPGWHCTSWPVWSAGISRGRESWMWLVKLCFWSALMRLSWIICWSSCSSCTS